MERNITIGLIIAFLLVGVGAFIMQGKDDGAGILIDFLKNHTNKTDINSTINESINQTISENITDNSTDIGEISFDATANYINNSILVSITADKENTTIDDLKLIYWYDTDSSELYVLPPRVINYSNITLPTVIEIPDVPEDASVMTYCLDLHYNGTEYRIPSEGDYTIPLTTNT